MSDVVSLDRERARRRPRYLTQVEAESDWRYTGYGDEHKPILLTETELRAGTARGEWNGRGCPCLYPDSPDPTCPIVGHFYGDVDDELEARAQHPAGKLR